MKILLVTLCLLSTVSFAQNGRLPGPVPVQNPTELDDALPENYVLKLVVSEKDQPVSELSVVVATTQFHADSFDPSMTLVGTLAPEEDGSMLFRYTLGTEMAFPLPGQTALTPSSVQYKNGSVRAGVRLRIGEPIQILKSGTRSYQLTISRLSEVVKKAK